MTKSWTETLSRLQEANLTDDHRRTISVWLNKFLDGAEEHGGLDLHKIDLVGEIGKEFMDISSYFAMAVALLDMVIERLEQIPDIEQGDTQ